MMGGEAHIFEVFLEMYEALIRGVSRGAQGAQAPLSPLLLHMLISQLSSKVCCVWNTQHTLLA